MRLTAYLCTSRHGNFNIHYPLTDVSALIPGQAFVPGVHVNCAQTVVPMKDGLPKFRGFPTEPGSSGEVMAEWHAQTAAPH